MTLQMIEAKENEQNRIEMFIYWLSKIVKLNAVLVLLGPHPFQKEAGIQFARFLWLLSIQTFP